jgi:hypothetical protein
VKTPYNIYEKSPHWAYPVTKIMGHNTLSPLLAVCQKFPLPFLKK